MAGTIYRMINTIIEARAKGNVTIANTTKTKLIMKGINIGSYTVESEDNPIVIANLKKIAEDMGIALEEI